MRGPIRGGGRRLAALGVTVAVLVAGCHDMSKERAAYDASKASAASVPGSAAGPVPEAPATGSSQPTGRPSSAPTSAQGSRTGKVDTTVNELTFPGAAEASGLAVASREPGVFFLVDDGASDQLLAVRADGRLDRRITVTGMGAGNAEALASGTCGTTAWSAGAPIDPSGACLYVGDIGDNAESRDDLTVYRLAEPAAGVTTATADAWSYTYPDGAHDAEAMLVQPDGALLIITKPKRVDGTMPPHVIYRGAPGGGTLRLAREFSPPAPRVALQSLLTGNVVTDAATDGSRVLLLTYDQLLAYRAPNQNADLATFPDWPVRSLPLPPMVQAEGVSGTGDGCGYAVASEAGPSGTDGSLAVATCR